MTCPADEYIFCAFVSWIITHSRKKPCTVANSHTTCFHSILQETWLVAGWRISAPDCVTQWPVLSRLVTVLRCGWLWLGHVFFNMKTYWCMGTRREVCHAGVNKFTINNFLTDAAGPTTASCPNKKVCLPLGSRFPSPRKRKLQMNLGSSKKNMTLPDAAENSSNTGRTIIPGCSWGMMERCIAPYAMFTDSSAHDLRSDQWPCSA